MNTYNRILVIRRDNIGDLVCTLPLIKRIREQYPDAWIGCLVTRYNAEVLHDNPDLDAVFTYTKAKHLAPGESQLGALWQRFRVLWRLRHADLDLVLLPASGTQNSARRMARLVGAKKILAQEDLAQPTNVEELHEVERTAHILRALDVSTEQLPAARLYPRAETQQTLRAQLHWDTESQSGKLIGIHISSRKPSQRWPAARFVELIHKLHTANSDTRFALFWSPGDEHNPQHPGDDQKAQTILSACIGLPVQACATQTLGELIAGLSLCDQLICSDGGHMHLAAALGMPLVCLFGKSDAARWHPWRAPYRLLQPESETVEDVSSDELIQALQELN